MKKLTTDTKGAEMEPVSVKLLWVEGDAEEFADLIGSSGTLSPAGEKRIRFTPEGRGDWLTMESEELIAMEINGKIGISTKLGNKFVFKRI